MTNTRPSPLCAGAGGLHHHSHDLVDHVVSHDDVDHHLRQVANLVLGATPEPFRVFTAAVSADLHDGDTRQLHLLQRIRCLVELVRSDDALDQLHDFLHSTSHRSFHCRTESPARHASHSRAGRDRMRHRTRHAIGDDRRVSRLARRAAGVEVTLDAQDQRLELRLVEPRRTRERLQDDDGQDGRDERVVGCADQRFRRRRPCPSPASRRSHPSGSCRDRMS